MREITEAEMQEVDEQFTYHAPTGDKQLEAYALVRARGKELAVAILNTVPPCADRTAAIRKVREAVMTANAAIALHPTHYAPGGDCAV